MNTTPSTSRQTLVRRALAPIVELREGESTTALLLFAYSFLVMTAYNIIKPVTRSKFIADLGADNLPYVLLAAGVLIGLVMTVYGWAMSRVPRRWGLPVSQAAMSALLVVFWFLFKTRQDWVSVAFYLVGLILGVLLISQFWTLVNVIYDPRQAKRLFGFVGGGAPLGGIVGSAILTGYAKRIGTENLLLYSAGFMAVSVLVVSWILSREQSAEVNVTATGKERGVGSGEALQLLRQSRHLQIIALVIAFAAIGAAIIEQQLNMAAEVARAATSGSQVDAMTSFLGQVQLWTSTIGLVVQLWVTSRVHRYLGIGFALMILPVSLGASGIVMLLAGSAALWAPGVARVADQSMRYTIDKTTREILFLPLPADIKYKAKPFIDVTVDRVSKGLGAVLLLVLIKPWGLGLDWRHLSYASVLLTAVWMLLAIRARREYLAAFRRSIARQDVEPESIRAPVADLQTVETLIEELADPDDSRVLYAIELLEALDKRHLVTPLLLHHRSPRVRVRTLQAMEGLKPEHATRWLASIEQLMTDENSDVRTAAVTAIAVIRGPEAAALMERYLTDRDPRLVVTAAAALAASTSPDAVDAAESALERLLAETRDDAAAVRREVAGALGRMPHARFRHLLVPLMLDDDVTVARAAIRAAGRAPAGHGPDDSLLVPALVSLLRHRLLKEGARAVLVGYGESAVEPLGYFLHDQDEQIWVRRHVPATLARIPCQRTLDVLVAALADRDGFLRYKVITALETIRRSHPQLAIPRGPVEKLTLDECRRYCGALTLHENLVNGGATGVTLLTRALEEKQRRARDRIFRLLGLIHPQQDVSAVRLALDRGDGRGRAGATEYLDNVLTGTIRKHVMLILEDLPRDERVRRINVAFRTRRRDVDDTVAQLVHDDDQVLAAAAIQLAAERGVGALADDLEYVLAHRDVHDWYVFEAASWALAGTHLKAGERRQRWLEQHPTVEVASRLHRIPIFAHVSVDELFRIAGVGQQMRHERGQTICPAGRVPDVLHLLIDGDAASETDETLRPIEAPAALAFDELLAATPLGEDIRATDVAITLAVTRHEMLTLLSNNVEIAEGLFRMLIDTAVGANGARVLRGQHQPDLPGTSGPLTPIERVLVLRGNPLLERVTGEQLLALATIARDIRLVSGEALSGQAADPAMHVIVSGALAVEIPGATALTAGPGDTVGAYETLAGVHVGERITVAEPGLAIRLDRAALFELLADHVDMVQGILNAIRMASPRPRALTADN